MERNIFVDNARAVGFGLTESGEGRTYIDNPCPNANGYMGHFGGIVRNNFIFASNPALFASESGADTGIALWQLCNSKVYHNSLAFTGTPFSAIEYRFSNTQADIMNNLTTHNIMQRNNARANLAGNLQSQPLALFADGISGDLHLSKTATSAIDMGIDLAEGQCDDDIDGNPRPGGAARDIGADEIVSTVKKQNNTLPLMLLLE